MSTLVVFHAHPDDEAIATGGTMAKAAAAGHRVVLVVATRGERGEVAEGYLAPGEELWQRRVEETHAAAELLGVSRVEFLGYVDSGMMGLPTNDDPDVLLAGRRGGGGRPAGRHPHRGAGRRPHRLRRERRLRASRPHPGEPGGRTGRGHRRHAQGLPADRQQGPGPAADCATSIGTSAATTCPGDLDAEFDLGVSEDLITTTVDVADFVDLKRKAMAAHASQISESSFFLAMPPEMFRVAFGQEDYILCDGRPGITEADVFAGLPIRTDVPGSTG